MGVREGRCHRHVDTSTPARSQARKVDTASNGRIPTEGSVCLSKAHRARRTELSKRLVVASVPAQPRMHHMEVSSRQRLVEASVPAQPRMCIQGVSARLLQARWRLVEPTPGQPQRMGASMVCVRARWRLVEPTPGQPRRKRWRMMVLVSAAVRIMFLSNQRVEMLHLVPLLMHAAARILKPCVPACR